MDKKQKSQTIILELDSYNIKDCERKLCEACFLNLGEKTTLKNMAKELGISKNAVYIILRRQPKYKLFLKRNVILSEIEKLKTTDNGKAFLNVLKKNKVDINSLKF